MAGLAAAAELLQQGLSVLLLEARDRVGGRVRVERVPGLPVPLDLGAEFIHGEAPLTRAWLARAGSTAVDVTGERWSFRSGRVAPRGNLHEEVLRALRRAARGLARRDVSFAALLEGIPASTLSAAANRHARMLVQGFDAADASIASARAIVESWSGAAAVDAPTFRPMGGYDALLDALRVSLDRRQLRIETGTVVHELRWNQGSVEVEARQGAARFRAHAPRAIVTLPVGVLRAPWGASGAVAFTPGLPPAKLAALAGLASGAALKIMLVFDAPFWEGARDGRLRDLGFLHVVGADFPTFWTALPLRVPVLTAWTGGPNAQRLSGLAPKDLVARALDSLATVFGSRVALRRRLRHASMHDWQADPFARGAYSYVVVGGIGAHAELARPVSGTLFFAGEATDSHGEAATVSGALQSGQRAARELLRARSQGRLRAAHSAPRQSGSRRRHSSR